MRVTISMRTLVIVSAVVVLAVATWVLVDWLVVTDAKRIDATLTLAAQAAERHDMDAIVDECLDPDFRLGHMDREATRAWGKEILVHFNIVSVKKYGADVTVTGPTAHANVRAFVRSERMPGDRRLDWEFDLRKRDDTHWRITGVRVFVFFPGARQELPLEDIQNYTSMP